MITSILLCRRCHGLPEVRCRSRQSGQGSTFPIHIWWPSEFRPVHLEIVQWCEASRYDVGQCVMISQLTQSHRKTNQTAVSLPLTFLKTNLDCRWRATLYENYERWDILVWYGCWTLLRYSFGRIQTSASYTDGVCRPIRIFTWPPNGWYLYIGQYVGKHWARKT